jgi:hypothetical protein
MLASWTKILPYFIVAWYARRYCQVFKIGDMYFVEAYEKELINR